MSAPDVLKALGLEGAKAITHEEWSKLPDHKRHYLQGAGPSARGVYLRLADPPAITALRQVRALAVLGEKPAVRDVEALCEDIANIAKDALAEFDGETS